MFFVLSRASEVLLAPLTWAFVVIVFGLVRARHARRRRRALRPVMVGLAVLWVFSLSPVANALMGALERSAADTTKPDEVYDVAIVLGGAVDGQATASSGRPEYNESVERALAAFDLLRTGRAKSVILSAGTPTPWLDAAVEARVIARQLEAWGVDASRIVVEDRSRNTHENAAFSASIVRARGFRSIVLVTSAFHMKRAAGCFHAEGLAFDTLPVDYRAHPQTPFSGGILPKADQLAVTTAAIREGFGRAVYRLRGYSVDP